VSALDPGFGDRSFDVLGAHANRVPAIGVTWGTGDQAELVSAGAQLVINRPAALPDAVRNHLDGMR
jgi:phosphoglycolate phosphatase